MFYLNSIFFSIYNLHLKFFYFFANVSGDQTSEKAISWRLPNGLERLYRCILKLPEQYTGQRKIRIRLDVTLQGEGVFFEATITVRHVELLRFVSSLFHLNPCRVPTTNKTIVFNRSFSTEFVDLKQPVVNLVAWCKKLRSSSQYGYRSIDELPWSSWSGPLPSFKSNSMTAPFDCESSTTTIGRTINLNWLTVCRRYLLNLYLFFIFLCSTNDECVARLLSPPRLWPF